MSTRDEAVKLAQHYMVDVPSEQLGVDFNSGNHAEVETLVDLIIEAAVSASSKHLAKASEIRMTDSRNVWIEKKRGTLSGQVVGLLEQAYEAGWHDREEEHRNG